MGVSLSSLMSTSENTTTTTNSGSRNLSPILISSSETETFSVEIHGKSVPVKPSGALTSKDIEKTISSVPFRDWIQSVNEDASFDIKAVTLQCVDHFGPRVGFIKFRADVVSDEGKFIPGLVFMRGGSVAVLVILACKEEGEDALYTVLTLQPRVPIGLFQFPEIPAGMLDHSGDFAGVAAKELEEECEINISDNSKNMIDLTEFAYGGRFKGMYPSSGGCDEFIRLFAYYEEVSKERLDSLRGKLTGLREEGELITLKVVPLQDLWREAPEAKALSALALYDRFKVAHPQWPHVPYTPKGTDAN